jgi:hypothetical protein
MAMTTRLRRIVTGAILGVTGVVNVSAQTPPKPSSPVKVAPPTWSRVLQMPDGRSFVSDGGLAIDAALVKPAALPSVVIPVESTKAIATRMMAPHQEEISPGQLVAGRRENSFVTPAGVHLNGNYVTLFRRVLPARARLRTRGVADAITVVVDGEMVAFLMPLAAPAP